MSEAGSAYPVRFEGTPDVIAYIRDHADAGAIDRSDPVTADEPFGSPQSAIVGAISQNLQIIDLVFKTSTDALTFFTALAAFVKIPNWHGTAVAKNVKSQAVIDPAKGADSEHVQAFLDG